MKQGNIMRNSDEVFNFENKNVKKLVIRFNYWWNLILAKNKPKSASSVMVNFNKRLPIHVIEDKILGAFKEYLE